MAAEIILRVKVDKSQYKAFAKEVKTGITVNANTTQANKNMKEMGESAKDALSKVQSLGDMLTKKIAWYSISMAISSVTVAFKDAITEIKNVDTQLTNIAKVSGQSIEQLGDLADKAYSTASKYGVAASEYMESVYEYTKAGFQETADVMAELSTKAMLVGDTTAAVADKFLISANAAWNYGQNIEELSLLVDKADYINNNYATTFDKIADGFPRVASVASMAGMSAEQTMAALGTITATTQETASRAGTALRALILNILGDTSTEVEEGVTTTQEEIDSLRKVLEVYASDVVEAADATGTLINPMEALAELSKAYKNGFLTEKGLFEIESALGGKLRTNQLDALLKNFDMYQEMMTGMSSAFGTADKEIETMLTSWEAKSNILKNTWTEFISKTVSSSMFKDLIDWATDMLERFDNLGEVLPIVAGYFAALVAPAILANIGKTVTNLRMLVTMVKNLGSVAGETKISFGTAFSAIGTAVSAAIAIATTAYAAYKNHMAKIRQESQEATDEAVETAKTAESEFYNIAELYTVYKNAKEGSEEYKTASENLTAALGLEKDAVDGLKVSLEELTKEQLEGKLNDVNASVLESEMNIMTQAEAFGTVENEIIKAGQEVQKTYDVYDQWGNKIAAQTENVDKAERLRRTINAYKITQSKITALSAAYSAQSYSDILDAYQRGDLTASQKVTASDAYQKYSQKEIRKQINALNADLKETEYVGVYLEQIEAQAELQKAWDDLLNGTGSAAAVAKAQSDVASAEQEAADAAETEAEAQQKVADAFNEIAGGAKAATDAIDKYNKAVEADQTEEIAQAYVDAAKAAWDAIQRGQKGATEVSAFGDLWFSPEQIAKLVQSGISVADALMADENFKKIFVKGTDENGETVFNDAAEAAANLGEIIKDANLDEEIAKVLDTDDGMKIIVEDWDKLAEQIGIDRGLLQALSNQLGLTTPGLEAGAQYYFELADAMGAVMGVLGEKPQVDLLEVIEQAFKDGWTQEQVWGLVRGFEKLQEEGKVDLVLDDRDVETASEDTQALIGQMDQLDRDHIINIETNDEWVKYRIQLIKDQLESLTRKTYNIGINFWNNAFGQQAASGTDSAKGGATLVNEEGAEIIAANGKAWVAGGGKPTVTNVPKGAKIWTAGETKAILGNSDVSELFGGIEARASGSSVPSVISGISRTTNVDNANLNADTSDNATIERMKAIVDLRKSELELIEESGGSISAQIGKQKSIQAALVNEIKYLQQIGGKQEDINSLATEWYQVQNQIAELQKTISEDELFENLQNAINKQIDTLNDKRDAELEKIDTQIEKLQQAHDIQAETNELKEKELAVEEAKEALANAKIQRTVRVFNAAKGRWEWTYDASSVQTAKDTLTEAKQALADYKAEQAYQAKIDKLEAQQEQITAKYAEQTAKWETVLEALEEPVKSINAALKDIEKNATSEMLPEIKRINEALKKMGRSGIVYDSGGVLSGLGGIKATSDDEMILPPDITSKMLSPLGTSMFKQRLNELKYMYGATGSLAGYTTNSIGSQHNGDVYKFGNITLSKEQARNTSVYELVKMSRGLRSYSSAM